MTNGDKIWVDDELIDGFGIYQGGNVYHYDGKIIITLAATKNKRLIRVIGDVIEKEAG